MELFNEDCMITMARYPDNYFDLTVTSPPYNIGKKHHTGGVVHSPYLDDFPECDYQNKQIDVLNELYRVTKNDGSLFYNHKNRIKEGLSIIPYQWILKSNWKIKQEIVWVNGSQNFDKIRFFPMTERVYWLVKDKNTKITNKQGLKDYVLYGEWPSVGVSGFHSRAFPLKMVQDILHVLPDARKMLDPYLGSGTSAIAAHYAGLDFVGCELDKDYFDAASNRIDLATRQESLF